jgi:hypothetical protein
MSHSSSDNKLVVVTMGAATFSLTKEEVYHKALSAKGNCGHGQRVQHFIRLTQWL